MSRGNTTNSIYEVFEYGAIVYANEEYDVLITVNGAYYNWWNGDGNGGYVCSDCLYGNFGSETSNAGLYALDETTQLLRILDRAEKWFDREISGCEVCGDMHCEEIECGLALDRLSHEEKGRVE